MASIRYKLKRAIFKISPGLAERLQFDFALQAPNRSFLENQIFDYLNKIFGSPSKDKKLLFIGIDKHNWHYHRDMDMQFHTIEIKPQNAVYGQEGLHVVGSATELPAHYEHEFFDVVVANGLIGFGLDSKSDFERLLDGTSQILKPGGIFILGYNDLPERLDFDIRSADHYTLFEEFVPDIDGLERSFFRVNDEYDHTYVFMRKRG